MKHLLIQLLEKCGLVTIGRYRALHARLKESESRSKQLNTLVEEVRAESKDWKSKASEAVKESHAAREASANQLRAVQKEATHQNQRIDKLRTELDKLREQLDRARASQEELEALRARLANAERELVTAQEHLMAIEVKLDILEGAANVLDTRTRSVIAQRAGKIGVAV